MADDFERLVRAACIVYTGRDDSENEMARCADIVLAVLREAHAIADNAGEIAATDFIDVLIAQAEGGKR